MRVRAKFKVTKMEQHGPDFSVVLDPVHSNDPNHENKAFWDATPSGKIEMYINGQGRADHLGFKLGEEYYVDFEPAPPTVDD